MLSPLETLCRDAKPDVAHAVLSATYERLRLKRAIHATIASGQDALVVELMRVRDQMAVLMAAQLEQNRVVCS